MIAQSIAFLQGGAVTVTAGKVTVVVEYDVITSCALTLPIRVISITIAMPGQPGLNLKPADVFDDIVGVVLVGSA